MLVFMVMIISITGAAVTMTIINTQTISKQKAGQEALRIADNAAENALLQLLRNSAYNGEIMSFPSGTATISVSGTTTKTITAVGQVGTVQRTVEVTANHPDTTIDVTSWSEL